MVVTLLQIFACLLLCYGIGLGLIAVIGKKGATNFTAGMIILVGIISFSDDFSEISWLFYVILVIAFACDALSDEIDDIAKELGEESAKKKIPYFKKALAVNLSISVISVLILLFNLSREDVYFASKLLGLFPDKSTFEFVYFILPFISIYFVYKIYEGNSYKEYLKAINIVKDNSKEKGYFSIVDVYYALYPKNRNDDTFKKFINKEMEYCLKILDNPNAVDFADIEIHVLGNLKYYFFKDKFIQYKNKLKNLLADRAFISAKDLIKKSKEILSLSDDAINDFIIACDIEKRLHEDEEVFLNPVYAGSTISCGCCGKLSVNKENVESEGEWYCSDTCRETEEICVELANNIHNSSDYIESQKLLSSSVVAAIGSISISNTWIENFRAIQTSQDFLEHTKGVGTNAKGQVIDSHGNPIISTGHGDAAEIMNTKLDNMSGKNAKLVGGDNAKNGADRLVDGIEIQSKYCKSARSSVDSAFNGSSGEYRYMDKNGKPMQLEVPKDQYDQAVEIMKVKIKNGQVPGVKDPAKAKEIVRKGNVTLAEAKNYTKFCTKESLKFDAMNGAVVAAGVFGVSFIINASMGYFRDGDLKKALKSSTIVSMKAGGTAFTTFVLSSQLQRIPQVNIFLQTAINFKFDSALGKAFANTIARPANVSSTTAANTAIRSNVALMAATMAITSSIEVFQMMRGQISGMQCVKNIATNAGGVAGGLSGAIAGAALGSVIPGIGNIAGGIIGGIAGGFGGGALMKKFMDNFIEDDHTKKQRIFFFQMMYLAMVFKLSGQEANEFKNAIDTIIMNDGDFFGKKFNVRDMQPYANSVLKPIVVAIVAKRPMLPKKVFDEDIIEGIIIEEIKESA